MPHEPRRIAIVGAGPSGLTAAYDLQRRGHQVVVYEREAWVGGRTRTDRIDGYQIDAGAQLFGSMYTRFLDLSRELGLGDLLVRSPGRDALWKGGRAHEVVYGSVSSMLASGGLPLKTKLRLGTTYLPYLTKHGASLDLHAPELAAAGGLDGESIAAWGVREMGNDFVDYLVYPQLAAYYGALPEETSAGLYHTLAKYAVDVSVYGFENGAATLAEALARRVEAAGGRVHLSTPVESLRLDAGRVSLSAAGAAETFDGVILAVPPPAARELLDGGHPALAGWLRSVRARPALSVALLLDQPVGVRYFGLSFPRETSEVAGAACVLENKGGALVPAGQGALVALVRPDRVAGLLDAPGKEIVDAIMPDLARVFPALERSVRRARIYRWSTGSTIVYPGFLAHLAAYRRRAVEPGDPIELAGDYLYTTSVEGAITSGAAAADALAARLSSR